MLASKAIRYLVKSSNSCVARYFSSEYTKHFLMPSAKQLVAVNGLDASAIIGTGLGGRIMSYDVVRFMEGNKTVIKTQKLQPKRVATLVSNSNQQAPRFVDSPIREEMKSHVETDQLLKRSIPHAYITGNINMTPAYSVIKNVTNISGAAITNLDIAVKAICNALRREADYTSVNVNVCLGVCIGVTKMFTILDIQKKNLLDIHKAVEAGKASEAVSTINGCVTICQFADDVMSAGGILSCPDEVGTLTLGGSHKEVCVVDGEEPAMVVRDISHFNFAYNSLKMDEVRSNSILTCFKRFMETPEFLME